MKINIDIDEQYITELVSQEIANRIVNERTYENREAKLGVRIGVDKAGELAINALERQVPKEPVINDKRDNEVDWECPMCGLNVVEEEPYDNYCMRCGQKLSKVGGKNE